MGKTHKIVNMALIFILTGTLVCQEAYGLRIPIKQNKEKFVVATLYKTIPIVLRLFHKSNPTKKLDSMTEILPGSFLEQIKRHNIVMYIDHKTRDIHIDCSGVSYVIRDEESLRLHKSEVFRKLKKDFYKIPKMMGRYYSGKTGVEVYSELFRKHKRWLSDTERYLDELIDARIKDGNRNISIAIFGIGKHGYDVYTFGSIVLYALRLRGEEPSQWKINIDVFDIKRGLFRQMERWKGQGFEAATSSEATIKYRPKVLSDHIEEIKSFISTHLLDLTDPEQLSIISDNLTWDITVGTNLYDLVFSSIDLKEFLNKVTTGPLGFSIHNKNLFSSFVEVTRGTVDTTLPFDSGEENSQNSPELVELLKNQKQRKKTTESGT